MGKEKLYIVIMHTDIPILSLVLSNRLKFQYSSNNPFTSPNGGPIELFLDPASAPHLV